MTEDEKHLDLLSIFHYIVGGVTGFFSCFPLIHVGLGTFMLLGKFNSGNAPPKELGWIFVVVGGTIILLGWSLAVAMLIAGRKLKRRTSRTYCFIVAGLECMIMPFGTILGVFTIIVLMRDSVKQLYDKNNLQTS